MSKTSNHKKAPICAAFVESMRAVFGEITVLYVKENGIELDYTSRQGKNNVPLPRSGKEAGADARGNAPKEEAVK